MSTPLHLVAKSHLAHRLLPTALSRYPNVYDFFKRRLQLLNSNYPTPRTHYSGRRRRSAMPILESSYAAW